MDQRSSRALERHHLVCLGFEYSNLFQSQAYRTWDIGPQAQHSYIKKAAKRLITSILHTPTAPASP